MISFLSGFLWYVRPNRFLSFYFLKPFKLSLILDQPGICRSNRLEIRAIQWKTVYLILAKNALQLIVRILDQVFVEKSSDFNIIKCIFNIFHYLFSEHDYLYNFKSYIVMKCFKQKQSYCNTWWAGSSRQYTLHHCQEKT